MPKHTHPKKDNKNGLVTKGFNPFHRTNIKGLIQVKKNSQGNINFYYRDGSMQTMSFSLELFTDEKGEERRFGEIIAILNDIKHDLRAVSFRINS